MTLRNNNKLCGTIAKQFLLSWCLQILARADFDVAVSCKTLKDAMRGVGNYTITTQL